MRKDLTKVVPRAEELEHRRAKRSAERRVLGLCWIALAGRAICVVDDALTRWNDREDRIAARRRPRRVS